VKETCSKTIPYADYQHPMKNQAKEREYFTLLEWLGIAIVVGGTIGCWVGIIMNP
jgi:hypothetical protein